MTKFSPGYVYYFKIEAWLRENGHIISVDSFTNQNRLNSASLIILRHYFLDATSTRVRIYLSSFEITSIPF